MKNMITMTGSSFRKEIQALQDFVNRSVSRQENSEKIRMMVKHDCMEVACYSINGCMLGKFVASCLSIDKREDFSFYINVPPLLPKADEEVKILVDDESTIVEYVSSGYMFRTKVKDNSANSFGFESYLAGIIARPAFRIAFNARYLKRILQSLIKSDDQVSNNRAPVYMDIAGENTPILVFANKNDLRLLMPMRIREEAELNLTKILKQADPEPVLHKYRGTTGDFCPGCFHELKFLRSRATETKNVKVCPYCGKAIILEDATTEKKAEQVTEK